MPARSTPHDKHGAARRPARRRRAEEDQDAFGDQDQELDDQDQDQELAAGDDVAGDPELEAEDDPAGDQDQEPEEDTAGRRAPARGRGRGSSGRVSASEAAQNGVRSLVDLIAKKPEGVTAVEPTEDGWLVGVEVIEDQRVPSSADILAVYEAELDSDGTLMSYRRTARYPRGKGDSPKDA